MLISWGGGAAVFAVIFFRACQGADAPGSCTDSPKSTVHKLRHQLFCNYDRKERPTKNEKNATEIGVHQLLLFFYLDEHKNAIHVSSFMTWQWKDEYLTWNITDHDNIDKIIVTSDDIWVPDIATYDMLTSISYQLNEVRCILNYTGDLVCDSPSQILSECDVDIEYWPYDVHECRASIGPWSHTGEQVSLKLLNSGISTSEYIPDKDWELLNASAAVESASIDNETYVWVEFTYSLKSYHAGHASVVVPCFVLALVTLAAYASDPTSRERLVIIGVNILSHCYFLTYLGANLTYNGEMVPYVVLFSRDSLMLVVMSLVTSIMSRRMIAASSSPPPWIVSLSSCLLTTAPAHVLLFDEHKGVAKVDDVFQGWPESDVWRLLGVLLDRFSFIINLMSSVVLYISYVLVM